MLTQRHVVDNGVASTIAITTMWNQLNRSGCVIVGGAQMVAIIGFTSVINTITIEPN